jgi:LPS export ABC transporter permease LptG/LPS export ABC transporter permease LptF
MRLVDRYLIREALAPFVLSLLVFTFILIVPFLIEQAETLITKGVSAATILRVTATLLPQALGVTIPMALLLGLLVAFGRLSGDREFVALQACGLSPVRLLRPVAVLSILGWAITSYVMIVSLPSANQTFREITYSIVAARAEGEVRPRVFFNEFPSVVLYVQEIPYEGGWEHVFMADTRPGQSPATYLARKGRVLLDRDARTIQMILEDGTRHTAGQDGGYEVVAFESTVLGINSETVFPRSGPSKGDNEMTIAELQASVSEYIALGLPVHSQLMALHRKFSIPVACLVFGLLGLAFGLSNRRDGPLASFVLGIGVIFAYYVILWLGQALAKGQLVAPWLAVWLPNLILGGIAAIILVWRTKAVEPTFNPFLLIPARPPEDIVSTRRTLTTAQASTPLQSGWLSRLPIPLTSTLDRYIAGSYGKAIALTSLLLAGLFYIVTFLDMSDKLFKGETTWLAIGTYFWYATPQYVYYIVPMAVLLATLVTIGLLTKNSELVIMKACGVSLYRVTLPILLGALLAGGGLFLLGETVLGPANQRAQAVRSMINGTSLQTFEVLTQRWLIANNGTIYHYDAYEPNTRELHGLSRYEFVNDEMESLANRMFATQTRSLNANTNTWQAQNGWNWTFDPGGEPQAFEAFAERELILEPADYFAAEQRDPAFMSYTELRSYTKRLGATGVDVVAERVAMERKASFPFVALVMALIAVPFAVTTGRRGALYGVGVGIVLAITYWVTISVFAAIGTGALLSPLLAAWAPNLLFGAGAAYLLLTVRT